MRKVSRYVGLDVHGETIAVAVAETGGELREVAVVPNRPEAVRRLVKKLGGPGGMKMCYEAGPTGYALYWQLTALGVHCDVVAPTLVPTMPGDRVKTDRRDALKLARSYRAGDLTPVWVPDPAHEALRDLVRAREAAKKDQLRARNRLSKFLLRQGLRRPDGMGAWTVKHLLWMKTLRFEQGAHEAVMTDYRLAVERSVERVATLEKALDLALKEAPQQLRTLVEALQALRGVAKVTAATIATEVGSFSRFQKAKQFMGYTGLVASEHSSGGRTRRGGITKTGNAHLRRVLLEAAWNCRGKPSVLGRHRQRQDGLSEDIKAIALKAQKRLHARYWRLTSRGMLPQKIATAVARELSGFIWAVGVQAETELRTMKKVALKAA